MATIPTMMIAREMTMVIVFLSRVADWRLRSAGVRSSTMTASSSLGDSAMLGTGTACSGTVRGAGAGSGARKIESGIGILSGDHSFPSWLGETGISGITGTTSLISGRSGNSGSGIRSIITSGSAGASGAGVGFHLCGGAGSGMVVKYGFGASGSGVGRGICTEG